MHLTKTQQLLMCALRGGLPRSASDLLLCLRDASYANLRTHICILRARLHCFAEDIVCEQGFYRHVALDSYVDASLAEQLLQRFMQRLVVLRRFEQGAYARLGIAPDGDCAPVREDLAYIFVAAILGQRPAGTRLAHRCHTANCIRPAHIFWATKGDRERDRQLRIGDCSHEWELARFEGTLERLLLN